MRLGTLGFGMTGACPVAPVKDKSMTDEQLLGLARAAAAKAYAPYSNFNVGCAVESVDGEVVTGANMENACYRLGLCAEQSALTAAQHKFGLDKVARIAVVGGSGNMVCTPCGGCRQAILEAAQLSGRDVEILCGSGDGSAVEHHTIGELIPFGFGPANLRAFD
jgi:cytidine deaminase